MTGTSISSPKIRYHGSSCTFLIKAHSLSAAERAALILLLMAEFFSRKQEEMLAVRPGEVRVDFPVSRRELVSELTSNRGQFLIDLKRNFNVNIVSPKVYSASPAFAVIGQEVSGSLFFCLLCFYFRDF